MPASELYVSFLIFNMKNDQSDASSFNLKVSPFPPFSNDLSSFDDMYQKKF